LTIPDYISFRLECGHINTDISAKSGNGAAYHLDITQTLFGGRHIVIANVRDVLDTFGQGLHAYEDSYAHQGGLTGHGWRMMPDPDDQGDYHYSWPLSYAADDASQDILSLTQCEAGLYDWAQRFLSAHQEYYDL